MLPLLSQIRVIAICFGLILLCSCATENSARPSLPADASMNTSAGRDDNLFVKLHLENGKDLLFALDTGSPGTLLDKSLEPELGKRIGTRRLHFGWFPNILANKYKSPKLYLGNTCLELGDSVVTSDMQWMMSGRPEVAGILGMDCLRNYCIQLDFDSKKIYFIDPDNLHVENLGKPFLLAYIWGDLSTRMDFCGKDVWFGLDTGDYSDGTLKSVLLERMKKAKIPAKVIDSKMESGATERKYHFPELALGGETYTNLVIHKQSDGLDANTLGLQFLARHLVTLNFPKRTMYLKQTSVGPLVDEDLLSVMEFIKALGKNGQMPGLSKKDRWMMYHEPNPDAEVFTFRKVGDSSTFHYQFSRTSKDGSWKLEKAWRTDQSGKTIEEFPIP